MCRNIVGAMGSCDLIRGSIASVEINGDQFPSLVVACRCIDGVKTMPANLGCTKDNSAIEFAVVVFDSVTAFVSITPRVGLETYATAPLAFPIVIQVKQDIHTTMPSGVTIIVEINMRV